MQIVQSIKKHTRGMINYCKWLFRKPTLSFNEQPDIMKLVKDKQFYELRHYLPEFIVGKQKLSRWQSLGLIGVAVLIGSHFGIMHGIVSGLFMGTLTFNASQGAGLSNPNHFDACPIDSTHFAVVYTIGAGSGTLIIGSISAGLVVWGTPSNFASHSLADYPRVSMLDSTHLVIGFVENSGTFGTQGQAIVAVISGSTISSFGSPVSFTGGTSSGGNRIGIVALDATHFAICCNDNNNSVCIFKLGTVASGTTITFGAASGTWSGQVTQGLSPRLIKVNSTTFISIYFTGSDKLVAQVWTYSGTSLSPNSPNQITNQPTTWYDIGLLDSTTVVVAFKDGSSNDSKATIGTISGTSISFGSNYGFYSTQNAIGKVVPIDSSHFFVAYMDNNAIGSGLGVTGTQTAGVIAYDTQVGFPSPSNIQSDAYLTATFLNSLQSVIIWGGSNGGFDMYGAVANTLFVVLPTVTTQAVSSILATTAVGNGNITSLGGDTSCDKRGVVYDTATQSLPGNVAPASSGYASSVQENGGTFSTGAFTEAIPSLLPNTTYYVRAYAHNSIGYSYGSEVSFTTSAARSPAHMMLLGV